MKYGYFDSHLVPKGSFSSGIHNFLQNLPPVLFVFKPHICSSLWFFKFFSVSLYFGLSFLAKDFPFHISLSSFLSHPAAPVALPHWTSLYSQPFFISLQQQVHYPAVPDPNPSDLFDSTQLWCRASSAGAAQAGCTSSCPQMWLRNPD